MSKTQKIANDDIAAFVGKQDVENRPYTDKDIDYIMHFTGYGGMANEGAKGKGLLYEYYTPEPIVKAMWGLAYLHGFTNGAILEPSCGTGRFIKYIDPTQNTVTAYQFSGDDPTSYYIAKAAYPWVNLHNNYFESIFYNGEKREDKSGLYDLVIGNPPYGTFTGYYSGSKREGKRFPGVRTYDQYFIAAGIHLLKSGGLLVFIIPSTLLSGAYPEFKEWLSTKADLLEAYRLPSIFTKTTLLTDIIVFKKK